LVRRFALRSGLTEEEADDVLQETFVAISKAMPEFRYNPSVGSFRSWMLHTTQWRIYDQFRKRDLHAAGSPGPQTDRSTATVDRLPDRSFAQLEAYWEREWHLNLVAAALQRIKPQISAKQFQIFDLYVLKEWPVLKVARALSVSVRQVYLARHRVAKLIKNQIKQMEH
jgi:RNA polymerase sigma-70 factor (ECF subfamily)